MQWLDEVLTMSARMVAVREKDDREETMKEI